MPPVAEAPAMLLDAPPVATVLPTAAVPPELSVPPVPEEVEDVPEQAVTMNADANTALVLGLNDIMSSVYHSMGACK